MGSSSIIIVAAAGLLELFETRVDGVVSAELNLKGKPEPDILQLPVITFRLIINRQLLLKTQSPVCRLEEKETSALF